MHRFPAVLLTAAVLTSPAFAQETPPGPKPDRVQVSPAITEADVGQTLRFSAVGFDAHGKQMDAKPTAWLAAPFDVGAADEAGLVTVYAPGDLRVGAIVNGKTGWATVHIRPQRVTRVDVRPLPAPLVTGASVRLEAVTFTATGIPRHDVPIAWRSESPGVATVDAAGIVTGVSAGRAVIRATSEDGSGTLALNVTDNPIARFTVQPGSTTARTGDVIRFKASAGTQTIPAVQWSIGGEGAAIDAEGVFVAERAGTYIITAAVGSQATTASVVVTSRDVHRELEVVGRSPLEEFQTLEQWVFGHYLYATSAMAGKLWVYDVSHPESPVKVDSLAFDARILNDVSVSADGTFGIVTREGASNRKNGIIVLDTSDPAHPKVLSEYTDTVSGGVHSAYIDGRYVYLTDDATGSLRVISLADLKAPKEVARWQIENPLARAITSQEEPFMGGRYLHDVQVKDGLLYAGYWRDGLIILDVGNGLKGGSPESPKLVSQLRFNYHELYGPGWLAGAHAVFRYKNYVFVGDEVFPAVFDLVARDRIPVQGIVHVVDVSDVEQPRAVAQYAVPEGGSHNMWVEDDVLYMGYYSAGARVLDVSGELRGDLYRQGREIARLWTGDPKGYRPNQPFTWGAQPRNGLIYFNDINSGVWITRLKKNEPAKPPATTAQ
jgi:plastocyanin